MFVTHWIVCRLHCKAVSFFNLQVKCQHQRSQNATNVLTYKNTMTIQLSHEEINDFLSKISII